MNSDLLYLPVSLGEAIDKLTILDIKLEKITDDRKNDVKKEYEMLREKIEEFIIKYDNLYQTMKKVNLLIWDMMDLLRDGDLTEDLYLKVCKECVEYNDIRFRVKNKINYVSKSVLKEQKSYKINRLVIQINKVVDLINIIKYFSFIYDEIVIVSEIDIKYLQNYFEYDITIFFNIESKILDYKRKVIIEDREYTENEVYHLFNVSDFEIKNICK